MGDVQGTRGTGSGVEGEPPAENARSGDFSHDRAFDPEQVFDVIGREENAEAVSYAMRTFLANPDVERFEQAVAVFVRSARARGEPVERVLAVLIELAEAREGAAYPHDRRPTDLRLVVVRGVLLAFYGDAPAAPRAPEVERRSGDDRRRPDARAPGDDRTEVF